MFQSSRVSEANNRQLREKYKKPNLFTKIVHRNDFFFICEDVSLKGNRLDDKARSMKSRKVSHGCFFPLILTLIAEIPSQSTHFNSYANKVKAMCLIESPIFKSICEISYNCLPICTPRILRGDNGEEGYCRRQAIARV